MSEEVSAAARSVTSSSVPAAELVVAELPCVYFLPLEEAAATGVIAMLAESRTLVTISESFFVNLFICRSL